MQKKVLTERIEKSEEKTDCRKIEVIENDVYCEVYRKIDFIANRSRTKEDCHMCEFSYNT